jgi:hypothetical protein
MLGRSQSATHWLYEFGTDWIFYMVGRMDHYLERNRKIQPPMSTDKLPTRSIPDYLTSGLIFICGEMEDSLLNGEILLLGKERLLFSSDYPHGKCERMPRRICWGEKM